MKDQTHPNPPLSGRESCSPPVKGESEGVKVLEGTLFIPYNSKLNLYARQNRRNPTPAEKIMWNILSNKQFSDFKFTRQKPLDNFIVDFYCSHLLLVIEIDGDSHSKQRVYDEVRSDILKEKYKIEVIRYLNSDVLHNPDGVYINLLLFLSQRKKLF